MPKRVLVTGATGFLGRAATEAFASAGHEVHAVFHQRESAARGVRWHRADILNPTDASALLEAVRPTHLVHLAWFLGHGKFWSSPQNLQFVGATLELTRKFREGGGERAIFSGTCSEYGQVDGPMSEGAPIDPATLYGVAKDATRRVIDSYARSSGLSWAWARIFLLHGPHEDARRFVPHVARAMLSGTVAKCTHGRQIRDFLHVEDAARALVKLLDSDVTGPVNIASGEAITLAELTNVLRELGGGKGRVELGAIEAPASDPPSILADVRRLRDEVGFRPSWDLREGLRRTVEWLRSNPESAG